jgi:ABC-2 type transport system ATP-binding protein
VCTGDINPSALGITCITDIKRNGSLNEIIVNQYDDSILTQLNAQGLNISSVDRMSLEKIFVANVRAGAKA